MHPGLGVAAPDRAGTRRLARVVGEPLKGIVPQIHPGHGGPLPCTEHDAHRGGIDDDALEAIEL